VIVCPRCGQQNPDGFRFCGACASPLTSGDAVAPRQERKTVTVLFADLVGFTSKSERLDPEDVQAMLSGYYAHLREELERFGGTVEKFIGDAVMALFGAPVAHEDDPERAVRAALAIRAWILGQSDDLQVRIAVNTGEAVVSLGARPVAGEGMAAGDVVNTTARLQAAAPTNGILVGEQTYRSTSDAIEYRDVGSVSAKGKSSPIPAWEAMGVREGDPQALPATTLVGRDRELDLLRSTLDRVVEERAPQLVTLVGVPGIGKSRLVLELAKATPGRAVPTPVRWLHGRSLPYGDGVTFWALAEMVKAEAGILENDGPDQVDAKLNEAIERLPLEPNEAEWVRGHLGALVGAGAGPETAVAPAAGEAPAAWRRFFDAAAERGPVVLVFEDLHWADEVLLDFVDDLVDRVTDVPLLVLGTARPELLERRPAWGGGKTNALTISLRPLSDAETARLVAGLLERPVMRAETQADLLARAGGNPLYAEQFVRMLVERPEFSDAVPETVQGIIAARIDALAPREKQLLQDAAVVGQEFWAGAVAAIEGSDPAEVEEVLRGLGRKEFVHRARHSSVEGDTEFGFRHVLVRDVAYGQIPRAARARTHQAVARWIESLGRPEDHAELVAHHYLRALEYTRAGQEPARELVDHVRDVLVAAGDRSEALASYDRAAGFYASALELTGPDDPMRPDLLKRQGRTLIKGRTEGREQLEAALAGFESRDDPEGAADAARLLAELSWARGDLDGVRASMAMASELVADRPDSPTKVAVLTYVGVYHMLGGQHREAAEACMRVLPMARSMGLAALESRALNTLGTSRAMLGDPGGMDDLRRAIEVARDARAYEFMHIAMNNLSVTHYRLGLMREYLQQRAEMWDSVERVGTSWDRVHLRGHASAIAYMAGRSDEAVRLSREALAMGGAGASHYQETFLRALLALIALGRGHVAEAVQESERAAAVARRAKEPQAVTPALAALGKVLLAAGRRAEADAVATELVGLGEGIEDGIATTPITMLVPLIFLELGREDELAPLLAGSPSIPWVECVRAILGHDLERAASLLRELGSAPEEAEVRMVLGERLIEAGRSPEAVPHVERALELYRLMGATAYTARAEAVLGRIGGAEAGTV
jgi:class 3 adenylate cyclase/tetratricopeptide (TPR) repeat protein